MPDPRPLTLRAHGLVARILPMGATLQELRLEGHAPPLQLGLADPGHYPAQADYMGATVGRCANRISGARFELDGWTYRLEPNEGDAVLHGGPRGTAHRIWDVARSAPDAATLTLRLGDGETGFPGTMDVVATISLGPGACLRIDYAATTDAPTPCNLAHHTYWCLDDTGGLDAHVLTVAADRYTPVDGDVIPTGVAPVDGTRFDFRDGRAVLGPGGLDHNLCLSDARTALREVAALHSSASGVTMRMATTEPGLQVYDGAKLDVAVPGLGGRRYGPNSGVALEAQAWPDAPSRPGFPSVILRPGETYRQTTTFTFSSASVD